MASPELKLTPPHDFFADMEQVFREGKPLSARQHHFIEWHPSQFSTAKFDPLVRYYGIRKSVGSFLLPAGKVTKETIEHLKRRLRYALDFLHHGVEIIMTPQQLHEFKLIIDSELIYYYGNQTLTGAPFIHGGLPHIIYFQWGNYFGIIKYEVEPGEKYLKANLLVYFEDLGDRLLEQCVKEYEQLHRQELLQAQSIKLRPLPIPQPNLLVPSITPTPRLRMGPQFR